MRKEFQKTAFRAHQSLWPSRPRSFCKSEVAPLSLYRVLHVIHSKQQISRCGRAKLRDGPDALWSKQTETCWDQENTERVKKGRTGKLDHELSLGLNQEHIRHSMELIVSPQGTGRPWNNRTRFGFPT